MAKLLPLPAQNVAFVNKEDGTLTTVFYTWLQSLMNCLGQWFPLSGVTISPASGSITAYTTDCQFLQLGKIILFRLRIDISNAGSGFGVLTVTFPSSMPSALRDHNAIAGYDIDSDNSIFGEFRSDNTMSVRFYDAGSVIFTNAGLILGGTYEAA